MINIKKLIKGACTVGAIIALSACAVPSGPGKGGMFGPAGGGAYTSGANIGVGFDGQSGAIGAAGAMRTIFFAYDNDVVKPWALNPVREDTQHDPNVRPTAMQVIGACADYLVKHPGSHIRLEGYTDARGSHEYNIALGDRRGNAVADILKMDGVASNQITVISYGKEKPRSDALGLDEDSYSKNRRVVINF